MKLSEFFENKYEFPLTVRVIKDSEIDHEFVIETNATCGLQPCLLLIKLNSWQGIINCGKNPVLLCVTKK